LFNIARRFDVSVEALLWRLKTLHRLDKNQTEDAIERYKKVQTFYEERKDELPPERPERFRALAVKALRSGEISIGRFAEYLDISRHEAHRFLEHEINENEEITVVTP